jgi:hypothetical protein
MRRQLTTNRRRWVLGTLVAAILVLAVGASQGLAGASDKGQATAPVQYHNSNCGIDTGKRVIGKARFTLSGDGTLTVKVQLSGADPGKYHLDLYAGDGSCDFLENIGKFKVDSSGSGSKVSQTCCYSSGSYFVDAENQTTSGQDDNDSLIVSL